MLFGAGWGGDRRLKIAVASIARALARQTPRNVRPF
jgi:hypothetical protein